MIRKAIILAAGGATQAQPLANDVPAPLTPLLGKPVMEYVVEHLVRQGIEEIMVNVSHMGARVEQHFGDGGRFGARIGYSFEGHLQGGRLVAEPAGSAGALRRIQDHGGFIDETTVVLRGDAVVDLDIQAAACRHARQGAEATVITRQVAAHEVANHFVVSSLPDGRVAAVQARPRPRQALSHQASTGIYIIEPQVVDLVPRNRGWDIVENLLPELVRQRRRFFEQAHDFQWLDVSRSTDYLRIVQALMRGEGRGIGIPGTEVRPGVFCGLNARVCWDSVEIDGPVYIGSGAVVGPDVVLRGPVWIGNGCRVESGARVERSILLDHAQVAAYADAVDMIVAGRHCAARRTPEFSLFRWWGEARSRRPAPPRVAAHALSH